MPESPVIDLGAIDRLREWGGEGLPPKMIVIFLDHASERLEEIRDCVTRQDARGAGFGAHSLKSSAANVGASQLRALCEGVEVMAEAEDLSALEGLLPELNRAFSSARKELERILEEMME